MDFGRYLKRIDATEAKLNALQSSHLHSIPFENLDIHLNNRITLDLDKIYDKVINRKRGGFCYELNGLFAELLKDKGHEVRLLNARVYGSDGKLGPDFDHLALLVDGEWVADVGFGDSFMEPLKLTDSEQEVSNGKFRIVDENNYRIDWFLEGEWKQQYEFDLNPRNFEDFAEMCAYQQTSPESIFTRKIICSRATNEGRVTLSNNKKIITQGDQKTVEELITPEQLKEFVEESFGFAFSQGEYEELFQVSKELADE